MKEASVAWQFSSKANQVPHYARYLCSETEVVVAVAIFEIAVIQIGD